MTESFVNLDGLKTFKKGCDNKYLSGLTEKVLYKSLDGVTDPTWDQMFASGSAGNNLDGACTILRFGGKAPNDYMPGNYASGFLVRGADTYAFYGCSYEAPHVWFCGGNHSNGQTYKPVWGFSITGSNKATYNLNDLTAIPTSAIESLF